MRGFRGSRSAQNQIASRFGRGQDYSGFRSTHTGQSQDNQGQGPQRRDLPDWLKTPETKAREAQGTQQPKSQVAPVAKAAPAAAPQLRLVSSQERPQPAVAPKPKAAVTTVSVPAPMKTKAAVTTKAKSKAKPRATLAKKAKPAARAKRKAA